MNRLGWFLLGALSLLAIQALAASIMVAGAHGWSAREEPSALERWIALRARDAAFPAAAKNQVNPQPDTPEVLADARAHWADHCASCHANDGSGGVPMGIHFYPRPPDMRKSATQNLSDGELFSIIQNGIRMSGMPGWRGSNHDADDSWKLVRFIRHLPKLTAEERRQMEKLNPRSPEEFREQEEEEKFLKGEGNEPQQHHHH